MCAQVLRHLEPALRYFNLLSGADGGVHPTRGIFNFPVVRLVRHIHRRYKTPSEMRLDCRGRAREYSHVV